MAKAQMIWIACWKCGETFGLKESDYTHHASCGKC